ncbi:unnamed protein product [Parascedosporium putredinis]|uniref:Uncharacterized protein n=1 Tax=Parascedosporium putredinis TaxID=1442378 RepID=A0A9P1H5M8_9PEZI|nr:unnamed protein product [Parascedosporium putredinis]CAI7997055.1 unnamed protein product [Parascedosporium putredinis]
MRNPNDPTTTPDDPTSTPDDPTTTPNDPTTTPNDPTTTPNDPTTTPDDPTTTPDDPTTTPDDPTTTPDDPTTTPDVSTSDGMTTEPSPNSQTTSDAPTSTAPEYYGIRTSRTFASWASAAYSDIASFEPGRQLLSHDGASGAALAGAAVTMIPIFLSNFIADIGSAFAGEAIFLDTHYCDAPDFANTLNPCWPPRVSSNKWALTVVTTSIAVVVVSLVYVVALWIRTPQTVKMKATSSISSVASLMGHPEVEREFANVPSELSNRGLIARLQGKQYTLGDYTLEDDKWAALHAKQDDTHSKWLKKREAVDYVFAVILLALLGFCAAALAYADDPRRIFRYGTRNWTIGIRIFFALLAIAIAKYWSTAFTDVQSLSHFARMQKQACTPRETVNKKSYAIPFIAILPLARMGYMVAAGVAFTALLSEFFVIFLAGLPYRPGQLRTEYLVCAIISIIVLIIMLVAIVFLHRWRRSLPHMPRRPNSVAALMTYVAETNMSRDFTSIEEMRRKERERAIEGLGKSYGYGLRTDEAGRKRWVVDQVELEGDSRRKIGEDIQYQKSV